jgi:hypothetical protein
MPGNISTFGSPPSASSPSSRPKHQARAITSRYQQEHSYASGIPSACRHRVQFHLPQCAPAPYHLAVIIFKAVVPDLLVRILSGMKTWGPPEMADKDRRHAANLSRSHGVCRRTPFIPHSSLIHLSYSSISSCSFITHSSRDSFLIPFIMNPIQIYGTAAGGTFSLLVLPHLLPHVIPFFTRVSSLSRNISRTHTSFIDTKSLGHRPERALLCS